MPVLASNTLLGMLTSQLGISEQQANDGMKAIMDLAKQHLSSADYTRILAAAPDLGSLAAPTAAPVPPNASTTAAPTKVDIPADNSEVTGTLLGYASYWMGSSNLGQMAQVAQIFSQLGLSTEMIGKFTQIALTYANSAGGKEIMELLAGAVKF